MWRASSPRHVPAPTLVQPVILQSEEGSPLCYPGDPDHDQPERAIRNGRYEPENGFAAFFA